LIYPGEVVPAEHACLVAKGNFQIRGALPAAAEQWARGERPTAPLLGTLVASLLGAPSAQALGFIHGPHTIVEESAADRGAASASDDLPLCLGQDLSDVAGSHIEANVPTQKDFDPFLKRDLAAFFHRSSTAPIRVEYQLLREGPTQTGIAYPKFYAWVKVFSGSRLSQEGAVRLAAIDKARFEVTQFVPKSDVARDPQALSRIFPAALIPSILEKSGVRQ
jgi:hypothetical protein